VKDIIFVAMLAGLLAIAGITDYRRRIIPNYTSIMLGVLGLTSWLFFEPGDLFFVPFVPRLVGLTPACAMVIAAIKRQSVGGGDIKLMVGLGFGVGIQHLLPIYGLATLTGWIWAKRKRVNSVPLGTFVWVGVMAWLTWILLFGEAMSWAGR
jgi:Flp pilus assembly protein protease CpaA